MQVSLAMSIHMNILWTQILIKTTLNITCLLIELKTNI